MFKTCVSDKKTFFAKEYNFQSTSNAIYISCMEHILHEVIMQYLYFSISKITDPKVSTLFEIVIIPALYKIKLTPTTLCRRNYVSHGSRCCQIFIWHQLISMTHYDLKVVDCRNKVWNGEMLLQLEYNSFLFPAIEYRVLMKKQST